MSNMTSTQANLTNPRPCTRCNGEGRTHSQWSKDNGFEGPEGRPCHCCKGSGTFEGLDLKAIVDALYTTRGKTRRFRASFPQKLNHFDTVFGSRAYFVWRIARFHGGQDVTMPMTADMVTGGDPFKKELEALASVIAKKAFGTDMAAAYRWGAVLGYVNPKDVPSGLPGTAYESGPVADENKPVWELLELR